MPNTTTPEDPHRYDDMLDLPHHVSRRHPPMSIENRAAQFSPFAALTGYEAAVQETARTTDQRAELDETEKLAISQKIQLLSENLSAHPHIIITYFQPDGRKAGGAYLQAAGAAQKIDFYARIITMADGKRIPIDDIFALRGAIFAALEDL